MVIIQFVHAGTKNLLEVILVAKFLLATVIQIMITILHQLHY